MTMAGKGRMFMEIVHRSRKRLQLFWSSTEFEILGSRPVSALTRLL